MFGIFRRVIQWTSRTNRHFVGFDLEGNRFYEYPNPNDLSRTKRVVKYYVKKPLAEYTSRDSRLPVQWQAWLSYIRSAPPTLDELRADQARLQKLMENVARLQEKERNEKGLPAPESAHFTDASNPQTSKSVSPGDVTPMQPAASIDLEESRKRAEMQKSPLTAFQPIDVPSDAPTPWEAQPKRGRGS